MFGNIKIICNFVPTNKNNNPLTPTIMKTLTCTDPRISVNLMMDADGFGGILAIASLEDEYWFTIGWYKTEAGAIRSARKQLASHGYTLQD